MASRARAREFHRRHQLAPADGARRPECSGLDCKHFVGFFVGHRCSAVLWISVRQVRIRGGQVMAVAAFENDDRAVWPAADLLHVNCVIELDGSGVAPTFAQGGKLRVAILEAVDMGGEPRRPVVCFQVGMTFGAARIAGGEDAHAAAVLTMASGARERLRFIGVMDGPS